jgi:hypothetical protein
MCLIVIMAYLLITFAIFELTFRYLIQQMLIHVFRFTNC